MYAIVVKNSGDIIETWGIFEDQVEAELHIMNCLKESGSNLDFCITDFYDKDTI